MTADKIEISYNKAGNVRIT